MGFFPKYSNSIQIYDSKISYSPKFNILYDDIQNQPAIDLYIYNTLFQTGFLLKGNFKNIVLSSCHSGLFIEAEFESLTIAGKIEETRIAMNGFYIISGISSCSYFYLNLRTNEIKATNILFKSNSSLYKINNKKFSNCIVKIPDLDEIENQI